MSIVGTGVGVISLGMSCQTAFQIRLHASLIASKIGTGAAFQDMRMPFDWLICPPGSVSRMLDEGVFFPEEPFALQLNGAPHWQRFNIYFWHDFLSEPGVYDLSVGFDSLRDKYEKLASRFHRLVEMDRLVLVLSNSQNNLDMVSARTRSIAAEMSAADIGDLCDAADRFFARPCEYIVVTYTDRLRSEIARENVATYRIAKDASEWRGDAQQWARVFADYFGKWPQARTTGRLSAASGSAR